MGEVIRQNFSGARGWNKPIRNSREPKTSGGNLAPSRYQGGAARRASSHYSRPAAQASPLLDRRLGRGGNIAPIHPREPLRDARYRAP